MLRARSLGLIGFTLLLGACSSDPSSADGGGGLTDVPVADVETTPETHDDVASGTEVHDGGDTTQTPIPLRVMTFNTGSGAAAGHDEDPDDPFTDAHAALGDEWYGNGLAYAPYVARTAEWFATVDADIVVFQEIFWPGECPEIPESAWSGFVCETWQLGDPTVAEMVVGMGWQVVCHPGKPDKCAAVNERIGRFAGCDAGLCLDGLVGAPIDGCGSGARVARGLIERTDGGPNITLVSVHGSSGFDEADRACRLKQVGRVFDDVGDGEPGVNGTYNLVMGDFNTDPGIVADSDESAARWLEETTAPSPFRFVTGFGPDAVPTYGGVFNIDHVVTDAFTGTCWAAGITEGHPPVLEAPYFDHVPMVCDLTHN